MAWIAQRMGWLNSTDAADGSSPDYACYTNPRVQYSYQTPYETFWIYQSNYIHEAGSFANDKTKFSKMILMSK